VKEKTVRCRALVCFVVRTFWTHTDTLGLYCDGERQVMKVHRVSVFCYSKRCRL